LPVTGTETDDDAEWVTAGIVDAAHVDNDGMIDVVVDWKSDVNPTPKAIDEYRDQMAQYLAKTGAERGLIVFATSGMIVEVNNYSFSPSM
jgi:exodeoxyribonuclease-5